MLVTFFLSSFCSPLFVFINSSFFSLSSFVISMPSDHCTPYAMHLRQLNVSIWCAVGDTQQISYFDPPIAWIALLCSLLLGFGDACINTQIYTMLAGSFASNSVAAFAVFKFTQVSEMGSLPSPLQSKVAMHEYQTNGDHYPTHTRNFKVIGNFPVTRSRYSCVPFQTISSLNCWFHYNLCSFFFL